MASNNVNIALVLRTKTFLKGLTQAQTKLSVFGKTAQTVGRTMQYALGGAILAAGFDAAKAAADFDLANAKLKALGEADGAVGIGKLAETARELGKNSIFTAAEVAQLQLEMKKLGLTVDDVDQVTEGVVKFATAMDTEATLAGATLIKTINKFGNTFDSYNSKQEATTSLSEQFANATLKSALNFETLRNGLNYAGGEADAAGFSFAETAAVLAKLADAGFEGSRGGVIFRKVLQSVGKTSEEIKKDFIGLIKENESFNEVLKIVGVRAAGGTLALGGLNEEILALAEAIARERGGIDGLFEAVDESLIGRLKNLRSAVQEIGIVLLEKFGPKLKQSISNLANFVRGIDDGDIKLAKFLIGLRLAAGAFNTFKGIAIAAAKGLERLVAAMTKLNPAGVVITALVAGMLIAKNAMDDFSERTSKAGSSVDDLSAVLGKFYREDGIYDILEGKKFGSREEFMSSVTGAITEIQDALDKARIRNDEAFGADIVDQAYNLLQAGKTYNEVVELITGPEPFGLSEGMAKQIAAAAQEMRSAENALAGLRGKLNDVVTYQDYFWQSLEETSNQTGTTKEALEGVIDMYERVNNAVLTTTGTGKNMRDRSATSIYEEIEERLGRLRDAQMALNDEKFRELQYSDELSEDLQKRISDNDLLIAWLSNYSKMFKDLAKAEEDAEKKRKKNFVVGYRGRVQTQEQIENQAKLTRELADLYAMLPERFQRYVDKIKESGYSMQTSLAVVHNGLQTVFQGMESGAQALGAILARSIIDPTQTLAENLREAGRQFAIMAATMVAKVLLLTGLIALGNALTGGALGALLNIQARAGNLSGAANLSNNLATPGQGVFANFRGAVAGNDLVFATTRGVVANNRIYG